MTEENIEQTLQQFVLAASRCKNAGFDAIDIDGGAGYLIQQFMSPFTNKRKDRWGGSLENRMRFPIEVVERIRKVVGENYPLIFDLCLDEYTEGGITVEQGLEMAVILEETGIEAFRIHGVNIETYHYLVPTMETNVGINIPLAEKLKHVLKSAKVMLGQRINSPELAEKIVSDGVADIILLGRPLITDSHFTNKIIQNKSHLIRKCIACNHCVDELAYGRPIRCALNPLIGFEKEYSDLKQTQQPRKVVIVGGGPSGLEAATTATMIGHKVVLFEKKSALGGQLIDASLAPHKSELAYIYSYYINLISELNIDVRLNTEADLQTLLSIDPDILILATGAKPSIPDIDISDHTAIAGNAIDIIKKKSITPNSSYIVIGGGSLGLEVAELLTMYNCDITVIEMSNAIGMGMGMSLAVNLQDRLKKHSIKYITGATVHLINGHKVYYHTTESTDLLTEADNIIFATGYRAERALCDQLNNQFNSVAMIGDCDTPRKIVNAIHEGFHIARAIN
jgi:2,4-dienoyl-CoA reductase (NADPH2)